MYGGAGLMPSEFFGQRGPERTVEIADTPASTISTPSTIVSAIHSYDEDE